MSAQVAQRAGRSLPREVSRGRDGQHLVAGEVASDEARLEFAARPERDVEAAPSEIDQLGGEMHVDPELGVLQRKIAEQREKARIHHGRNGDAQITAHRLVRSANAGLGVRHGVEHDAGVPIQSLAGIREDEAPGGPAQQTSPEALLEPRQAPADGGSWDAELGCRTRQRFGFDSLREREQLGGLDRFRHMDQIVSYASNCRRIASGAVRRQSVLRKLSRRMIMKIERVGYWAATGLVALAFGFGGALDIARTPEMEAGLAHLGYPAYFATILGIWKVLGAIAVVVPRFPRLKEWAYAGMVFDLTGAAASHAAVGDPASNVAIPLVLLLLVAGSWALRPEARVWRSQESGAEASRAEHAVATG